MIGNIGTWYILNGVSKKLDKPGLVDISSDGVVYEVIRVVEKVPVFLEDHYIRLKNSLGLIGSSVHFTQQELKKQIRRLIEENEAINCNVKLIVYSGQEGQNLLLHINKSYYPSREEVDAGVVVSLFQMQREKPNVKAVSSEYKEKVTGKIQGDDVFEVLLVNKDGRITEGSKSNVFFVKGQKIYTAPGEYVLKGITRQYVVDACKRLGFEIIMTLIGVNSLNDMDGLFITGTSIKVLPISEVDGLEFNSSTLPVIVAVRDLFDRVIDEYVRNCSKNA